MDYTTSPQHTVHPGTGNRRHEDAQALPTVLSDDDINQLTWSMMEVVKAAGLVPSAFNVEQPTTYRQLLAAIQALVAAGAVSLATVDARIAAAVAQAELDDITLATVNARIAAAIALLPQNSGGGSFSASPVLTQYYFGDTSGARQIDVTYVNSSAHVICVYISVQNIGILGLCDWYVYLVPPGGAAKAVSGGPAGTGDPFKTESFLVPPGWGYGMARQGGGATDLVDKYRWTEVV